MKVNKLIKVSTSWCGPCRQLKTELKGFNYVPMEEFDADEDETFCTKYNIRNVPVIIFFDKDGNELGRNVGFITKDALIKMIDSYGTI